MNFEDISQVLTGAGVANLIENESLPPRYPMHWIFSELVIKEGNIDVTKHAVNAVLDFKDRDIIVNNDKKATAAAIAAGLKLFALKDYPSKKSAYPRYFMVWMSPWLKTMISEKKRNDVPVHVLLHPIGEISTNEDKYYKEDNSIDPYYLSIGINYLLTEHFLVYQHRYAVRVDKQLKDPAFNSPICLVFPIFSGTAHRAFPKYDSIHFLDIMNDLVKSAMIRYFPLDEQSKISLTMGRFAISAFSIGGQLLQRMFAKPNDEILKKIDEVYTFDCILDYSDRKKAFDEFWKNLKTWQGDDNLKMIRLYSAEAGTVASIQAELEFNLIKYGGGKLIKGQFRKFDGVTVDKYLYKFPEVDVEIHSTDNSRILVLIPLTVFDHYEKASNPHGIHLWAGHPWFVNSMPTHALYHSFF